MKIVDLEKINKKNKILILLDVWTDYVLYKMLLHSPSDYFMFIRIDFCRQHNNTVVYLFKTRFHAGGSTGM